MSLLLELQKRLPDRWMLRRLFPALLFVTTVAIGRRLGWRHWADTAAAHRAVASVFRTAGAAPGSVTADLTASVVLVLLAAGACATVVPYVAGFTSTLVSGAWPWWLTPLGRLFVAVRTKRWLDPKAIEALEKRSVSARGGGRYVTADRLDARRRRANPTRPRYPTKLGDQLRATERLVEAAGRDIGKEWSQGLLGVPEQARTLLREARDAYDGACEAVTWSAAFLVFGAWWPPAAVVAVVVGIGAWRAARQAGESMCALAEAVFVAGSVAVPGAPAPSTNP